AAIDRARTSAAAAARAVARRHADGSRDFGGRLPAWIATRSAARPCHIGEYLSPARSADARAAVAARPRTSPDSHRMFKLGAASEPLFPWCRWEVARTGTELIPLAPAAPMKTDTARKANAMSAIRGCLRILLLLGVSETPVGSRWDALMRA